MHIWRIAWGQGKALSLGLSQFTSPFFLSAEDGALISVAVVGVWCIAWAFKALALTLRNDGESLD